MALSLRTLPRVALLASLLAASAASCGGGDGPAAPTGTTLIKFAGDEQDGSPGDTLFFPLVVRAADAQGAPVVGRTVTFAIETGGGSLTNAQAETDALGVAETTFILGPVGGVQTVSASMRGAAAVTFSAIATADPATVAQLQVVSGNAQSGQVGAYLANPLVVRAVDQGGNPLAGVYVDFEVPTGDGSVSAESYLTNASGQVSAQWRLGTVAGAKTLTATVAGIPGVTLTATATPGSPATLRVLSGNGQFGTIGTALPNALTVGVADSYGNPVGAGASVSFAVTGGGGSVSPATVTTGTDGRASTTWTMGPRVGGNALSASATGLTSTTATATASVALSALDHRVVDAEMSTVTGRIITVSANPSRLNIIDPETGAVQTVALQYAPLSVSVSLDGARAAVGHDGYLSSVNLLTPAVSGTYAVSSIAGDVVMGGNGYAYVFPSGSSWTNIRCVNLTTGAVTLQTGFSVNGGTVGKLHPSGSYIYGADRGLSPSDFEKYDIRGGTAAYMYDSPYHGDYDFSGNVWSFDDGSRLIAASGNLFRTSTVQAEDMTYAGSLPGARGTLWATHSTAASRVLLFADGAYAETAPAELRSYDPSSNQYLGSLPLPKFNVAGAAGTTQYTAGGHFVFYNADGKRAYTLIRADAQSGLALDWGLAVFDDVDIP
jgi:hypothetical protein